MGKISSTKNMSFIAEYSRRFPDPLNQTSEGDPLNIEHHILISRAINIPDGISKSPNPREQNTDRAIYKQIRASLDDASDLSFHLKNKGITIIARRVDYSHDKRTIVVSLGENDGIADGAHTYEIIREARTAGTCPEDQFVKLEILTGVPQEMGVDITGGLNTAIQVEEASLLNLAGEFEWIKEILSNTSFGDLIAYKQNAEGEYDIREILGLMTLFNINLFPYPQHPKVAYVSKAACLDLYIANRDSYKMLNPLLLDILQLHDYVQIQGRIRYNEDTGGRAASMIGVFATKKKGTYSYIFTGSQSPHKIYDGALYPMLGALRFLVQQKPGDNVYSWKLNSIDEVKAFYDEIAADLISTTYKTSLIYGRKPNPIGKDDNHWDNMYKTVALHYLSKYSL
ncbi:MAG: AIPR family protein [Dehalococcoidales bacterium]|nr:AIPR family protein [Dehalococcoidales bacterium]